MTTKELSQVAGVSERTIRRIAENEVGVVFVKGKRAIYNERESIEIMRLARKKGFIQPRQNADVHRQNAELVSVQNGQASSFLSERDIAIISQIVSVTVSETIKALDGRMTSIEQKIESRKALLPPPQIKPRDHINMIVREYVSATKTQHGVAWGELYRQFSYRTNTNPTISAKNRGMSILDYIEAEGMIETLESVAMEVMK